MSALWSVWSSATFWQGPETHDSYRISPTFCQGLTVLLWYHQKNTPAKYLRLKFQVGFTQYTLIISTQSIIIMVSRCYIVWFPKLSSFCKNLFVYTNHYAVNWTGFGFVSSLFVLIVGFSNFNLLWIAFREKALAISFGIQLVFSIQHHLTQWSIAASSSRRSLKSSEVHQEMLLGQRCKC